MLTVTVFIDPVDGTVRCILEGPGMLSSKDLTPRFVSRMTFVDNTIKEGIPFANLMEFLNWVDMHDKQLSHMVYTLVVLRYYLERESDTCDLSLTMLFMFGGRIPNTEHQIPQELTNEFIIARRKSAARVIWAAFCQHYYRPGGPYFALAKPHFEGLAALKEFSADTVRPVVPW